MITDKTIWACFAVLWVLMGVSLRYRWLFNSYLKSAHVEVWQMLCGGASYPMTDFNVSKTIMRFLIKKEYLRINDARLTILSKKLLLSQLIYIVYMLAFFVLGIIKIGSDRIG